jgi:hypothetical protein
MKKNWIYLFMLMVITVMPLTSCDKEDEPKPNEEVKHDPESDADQIEVKGYDALEWLQGNIVVVDENNEVVRRIYGEPLDASQPTVLSVPVKDLAGAEEIFLSWVAPGKEATKVEGGYDYNLTDAKGNAQGSVSFRAVEDDTRVIAVMTVADGTDLKLVSEIQFINAEHWENNALEDIYQTGHTYVFPTPVIEFSVAKYGPNAGIHHFATITKDSPQEYYCIQGNVDQKEAILVWLSPDKEGYYCLPKWYVHHKVYQHLPTVAEAQKLLDCYNEHGKRWDYMLNQMDAKGYQWSPKFSLDFSTTYNSEFILNGYEDGANTIKCLDLDAKKGKICDVVLDGGFWLNEYRYMYIRIIPRKKW